MSVELERLTATIVDDGEVTAEEAREITRSVYQDGVVSRAEAEQLFSINNQLAGNNPHWDRLFVETIKDFLLTVEAPEGWCTKEEGDWLIEQITRDGNEKLESEVDLLIAVLRYAEGAPLELSRFALNCVCDRVRNESRALPGDIERLRLLLYASSGEGQAWVSRYEATQLFRLNDDICSAPNDPSWNELFARAIGNHLLASAHPNPVDEGEALRREAWVKDTKTSILGSLWQTAIATTSFGSSGWFKKVTFSPEKAMAARTAAIEAAQRAGEEVTEDESDWFLKRLGWDKKTSPAEKALIDLLKEEAPGFVQGVTIAAAP